MHECASYALLCVCIIIQIITPQYWSMVWGHLPKDCYTYSCILGNRQRSNQLTLDIYKQALVRDMHERFIQIQVPVLCVTSWSCLLHYLPCTSTSEYWNPPMYDNRHQTVLMEPLSPSSYKYPSTQYRLMIDLSVNTSSLTADIFNPISLSTRQTSYYCDCYIA